MAQLRAVHEDWTLYEGTESDEALILGRIKGAELVVLNKVKMTRGVFEAAKDLKIVIVGATGVDNVDLQAARDHGVMVCNVRGYSTPGVAQYVFAGVLELMSSPARYDALVKSGAWQNNRDFCLLDYPMYELSGRVMGLVGYGDIAQAVERIARAFGMEVLVAERAGAESVRAGRVSMGEVLRRSDVLSLHCPLTAETRGLIGAEELALMKNTAVLVNAARGGVVDEAALAQALRAKQIFGAVVDVLTQEPPKDGNPLLDPALGNLVITPHCAWASVEARRRMFEQIAAIIESYKAGTPINRVT